MELKANIIDALKLVLEVKSELKKSVRTVKSTTATSVKKRIPSDLYELTV